SMPLLTAYSHPAGRGAINGAVYAAAFTFVTAFLSLSGPPLVAPPISRLLASTAVSLVAGAFGGAVYGLVLGRATRRSFGAHVRAGLAGGAAFTLPVLILARQVLSGRWSLLLITIGAFAGGLLGMSLWLQDFANHRGKPAA